MASSVSNPSRRNRLLAVGAIIMLILVIVALLPSREGTKRPGNLSIACTFLPNYVFTLNIVGDAPDVTVKLLVPPETGCPHGYTVSPADLKLIAGADVIVANGLGLEHFLDRLRRENPKAPVITISDECDVLKTQSPDAHDHSAETHPDEGSQTGKIHGQHSGHDGHTEHGEDEEGDANPHVWVSPVQAIRQIRRLSRQLAALDASRAKAYQANTEAFIARIEKLHQEMLEASRGFANRRIVTFHDAFAYLARDLGLEVVATLTIDPNRPPSAQEMLRLIATIRETRAAAVFYESAYSDSAAKAIARDAGVRAFELNPFNTLDGKPTARSYEDVMEQNLKVLRQALGAKS